jgi:hypothetical protein
MYIKVLLQKYRFWYSQLNSEETRYCLSTTYADRSYVERSFFLTVLSYLLSVFLYLLYERKYSLEIQRTATPNGISAIHFSTFHNTVFSFLFWPIF